VGGADLGGHGRLQGLLEPEAGQILLAAWSPWPARPTAMMTAVVISAAPMP
jgi:hypothetical protein